MPAGERSKRFDNSLGWLAAKFMAICPPKEWPKITAPVPNWSFLMNSRTNWVYSGMLGLPGRCSVPPKPGRSSKMIL